MTYATVVVSLALDQPNEARLQVAGELAERFEATIVGVAAAQFAPPLYFADGAEALGLIDREQASVRNALPSWRRNSAPRRRRAADTRNGAAPWIFPGGLSWRRCGAPTSSSAADIARFLRCLFACKPEGSGNAGWPAAPDGNRRSQLARSA